MKLLGSLLKVVGLLAAVGCGTLGVIFLYLWGWPPNERVTFMLVMAPIGIGMSALGRKLAAPDENNTTEG